MGFLPNRGVDKPPSRLATAAKLALIALTSKNTKTGSLRIFKKHYISVVVLAGYGEVVGIFCLVKYKIARPR